MPVEPTVRADILDLVGHDPVDLERLVEQSGREPGELVGALLELELAQHVDVCRVTATKGCVKPTYDSLHRATARIDCVHVFDVLVYLYENYGALHACPDSDSLSKRLTDAGFDDDEISDALIWLSGLQMVTSESIAIGPESERAFRVYAGGESGAGN